jgi:8-oxo-dGTP pyrophosphatase MutT (NUDIX family)
MQPWEKLSQNIEYNCGLFRILKYQSRSPQSHRQYPFWILSTHDWVNIVALTPDFHVMLVSQYRHGTEEISLEIPGGAIDPNDSTPQAAAQRELLEETGCQAQEWAQLGSVYPNPAIQNNRCFCFLALGVQKVSELHLDPSEELEVEVHPLIQIPNLITQGIIRHSLVIVAFYFLREFQRQHPEKITVMF